jgi:hypothetical protein
MYFRRGQTFNVQTGAPQAAPTVISLGNAVDWARAEASLALEGPVPEPVYLARLDKCVKCPQLVNSDENPDAVGWCAACGCGTKARAALSVKLTMPAARCPRQEWGEFKGSVDDRRQEG